jgi:hypothetical protein
MVLLAAMLCSALPAVGAPNDYKLGEVAVEDVITPVPLLVVNPEATEALKQKVSQQVLFVVRSTPQTAAEAEAQLRESIASTRVTFLAIFKRALEGRAADASDVDTPLFTRMIAEVAREAPKDLPFDQLAPLWVRGQSDEPIVESLLQPIREVMSQPIVVSKTDATFPANQSVRLLPVKNANEPPTPGELNNPGQTLSSGKVLSLWRAKRVVETYFPAGQEDMGRFASSFVRPNAYPDPALTEILRAKRLEGITVNDSYDAAQVIVRRGQVIDRKALSALAVMREKSAIGMLQTKLEQEKTVSGRITQQTKWIAGGLGVVCVALLLILWRLRARPSTALVPVGADPALAGWDPRALPGGDEWRARALVAEGKVERAHEAIRTGMLGWMREKIFRTLSRHRAELLSAQQKAELEMRELEQRLEQLHTPLQERIVAYEKRIEELEKDLAAKGEENRQLIGARISVARQQLNVAREQGRFGAN